MVHFVGFFRQLDPDGPPVFREDIQAAIEYGPKYSVPDVVSYLRGGHPILDIMESCPDVLDESTYIRGCSFILSDGEWVWRWDLAHYVEKYNVELPPSFVGHMVEESYRVPSVSQEDLIAITHLVNDELGFRVDPGAAPKGVY